MFGLLAELSCDILAFFLASQTLFVRQLLFENRC